jgi:hypothetical protein
MDITTTKYQDSSGTDLGMIFLPIKYGSSIETFTSYKVNNNDLSQIFASLGSFSQNSQLVGYNVNGTDLSQIFASINQEPSLLTPFIITSSSYSYIYDYSTQTYFVQSIAIGSGTIQFTENIIGQIHVIIIGGGGGGGGGRRTTKIYAGSGGGGGGTLDMYSTMGTGFTINTLYSFVVGSNGTGGTGGKNFYGTSGTASSFSIGSNIIATSSGGSPGGSFSQYSPTNGGNAGISTIQPTYQTNFINTFLTTSQNNPGKGGCTTPSTNYVGGCGYGSDLSANYYISTSPSRLYSTIKNSFLIYRNLLYGGGGGGSTEGGSSIGYSAIGGNGLVEFGGNLYGYTTNSAILPYLTNGQNNNPGTSYNFPNTTASQPGTAFGSGGAGSGSYFQTGGSGSQGIVGFYFNYPFGPKPNNYFKITENSSYCFMSNGSSNYFIINCSVGTSTIEFVQSVNATIIVVGGGGSGSSSANLETGLYCGAGSGGGGCGIYNQVLNSTYNVNVGLGGYGSNTSLNNSYNGMNGGTTTITDVSSNILAQATGGQGGKFSTTTIPTGGLGGTCTNSPWILSNSLTTGYGGDGGQGGITTIGYSSNSSTQSIFGSSSELIQYILPDGTKMFFGGGSSAGSNIYSGVPANYNGGGAGHGYGGYVGANINSNLIGNPNGQDAKFFGSAGGSSSSNITTVGTYGIGGNGMNGIVLIIFQV